MHKTNCMQSIEHGKNLVAYVLNSLSPENADGSLLSYF